MRALVIGSGGREHALAWKLAQSPLVEKVFIAPGNAGTEAAGENIEIAASDIPALTEFAKANGIDLVVPGPEQPLTLGIADAMAAAGIACFGPDKYCAQLEGSKSFAKKIMREAGVPTAKSAVFTSAEDARQFIAANPEYLVIKADGLAAGKGVVVADSAEEALAAIDSMLAKRQFGDAGAKILIEERLHGEEASLICICAGLDARPLASAQDHKAAYDHDQGPNTGGMGAYSPAPILPDAQLEQITDIAIRPILKRMADSGHPFRGALYAGLMITRDGPKVLEYNVRFGDPECQPLMARLDCDLAALLAAACQGRLEAAELKFKPEAAAAVVLAAEGYPGPYAKGLPIEGIEDAEKTALVFHSGAKRGESGLESSGGRVLCVCGEGRTLPMAQDAAYRALAKIKMPGGRYRKDIGLKGIARIARAWS